MSDRGMDFLRLFGEAASCRDDAKVVVEDGIELSLSLGGCFGVEPRRLKRSSSIASLSMFPFERDVADISRTCSLPVGIEERKRKEVQSLKRMEVKRRRLVKKDCRSGGEDLKVDGFGRPGPVSQGSVGSQGSGSSGLSDLESPQEQGNSTTIPSNHKATTPVLVATNPIRASGEKEDKLSSKKTANGAKEMERNIMEEMPCVSTQGDGPNGRRIQGFLYRYAKGEEVRIVCVCHGSFLTPAQFVKHAGGSDVAHPLRHIVVSCSTSSPFL